MRLNKLMKLGIIAPMFAMCVSCGNGLKRISFDEALNFAMKNYDEAYYTGYIPTYILKVNELTLRDTKIYSHPYKDARFEQTYYADFSIKDFSTMIDTDEIGLIHITSEIIADIEQYLAIGSELLTYTDAYFTLENNKYLGLYLGTNNLEQVVGIVNILILLGMLEKIPITSITSSKINLDATASCNNLGLISQAHLYLNIENVACTAKLEKPIEIDIVTSKQITLDVELIVNYK